MLTRIKRLARHENPIRMAAGYALMATGLHRFATIDYFGSELKFSPCHLGLYLWAYPGHRADDVSVLRKWLRPGDVYLDVGANMGSLAAVAGNLVGDRGRVMAFEPHPKTFSYLVGNCKPNMSAVCVALGDVPGEATLTDMAADDQNRIGNGSIRVAVARLDDLVSYPRIRLLKIDVEGYELPVLRGSHDVLRRTDAVYFEVSDRHFEPFGYRSGDVVSLLVQAGFIVRETDGQPYRADLDRGGTRNLIASR